MSTFDADSIDAVNSRFHDGLRLFSRPDRKGANRLVALESSEAGLWVGQIPTSHYCEVVWHGEGLTLDWSGPTRRSPGNEPIEFSATATTGPSLVIGLSVASELPYPATATVLFDAEPTVKREVRGALSSGQAETAISVPKVWAQYRGVGKGNAFACTLDPNSGVVGPFTFPLELAGALIGVRLFCEGAAPVRGEISLPAASETVVVDLEIRAPVAAPSAVLALIVADSAGTPVAGAVCETGIVTPVANVAGEGAAATDEDGKCELTVFGTKGGEQTWEVLVAVSAPGCRPSMERVSVTAAQRNEHRVVLARGSLTIRGRIVDSEGRPAAGVRVVALAASSGYPVSTAPMRVTTNTKSDESGQYVLVDVPEGKVQISVRGRTLVALPASYQVSELDIVAKSLDFAVIQLASASVSTPDAPSSPDAYVCWALSRASDASELLSRCARLVNAGSDAVLQAQTRLDRLAVGDVANASRRVTESGPVLIDGLAPGEYRFSLVERRQDLNGVVRNRPIGNATATLQVGQPLEVHLGLSPRRDYQLSVMVQDPVTGDWIPATGAFVATGRLDEAAVGQIAVRTFGFSPHWGDLMTKPSESLSKLRDPEWRKAYSQRARASVLALPSLAELALVDETGAATLIVPAAPTRVTVVHSVLGCWHAEPSSSGEVRLPRGRATLRLQNLLDQAEVHLQVDIVRHGSLVAPEVYWLAFELDDGSFRLPANCCAELAMSAHSAKRGRLPLDSECESLLPLDERNRALVFKDYAVPPSGEVELLARIR